MRERKGKWGEAEKKERVWVSLLFLPRKQVTFSIISPACSSCLGSIIPLNSGASSAKQMHGIWP